MPNKEWSRGRGRGRGIGKLLADLMLLLIAEADTYGYEIVDKLEKFGFSLPTGQGQIGRIYRQLSFLENSGFAVFQWDNSTIPARKFYSITDSGKKYLASSVEWAKQQSELLDKFVERANKQL